jgi:hypothetical protein
MFFKCCSTGESWNQFTGILLASNNKRTKWNSNIIVSSMNEAQCVCTPLHNELKSILNHGLPLRVLKKNRSINLLLGYHLWKKNPDEYSWFSNFKNMLGKLL